MTTALDIAKTTVARATQNYVRGGMSYCQQFAGNFWETFFGRATPNSYPSAAAAYRASSIVSKDWNAAPPGAYHYFTYGTYGHVGVSLGSGLMASGTGWGTGAVLNLGKNVLVHPVSVYAGHLPYLGWSYTNGARQQITGLTDANAPVLAPNQRQVKPNADARRRNAPSTSSGQFDANANLKANSIITPAGYVRSALADGQPNGSDVWIVLDGLYTHVSGLTDTGTHDLADLGLIEPPKPIIMRSVTIRYDVDPTNSSDVRVVEVVDGELLLPVPASPERDGYLFLGWGVNGVAYDFSTPVTQDFTLQAMYSIIPDPEPEPEPGEPVDPAPVDPEVPSDVPNWFVQFIKAVLEFLSGWLKR